MSKPDRVMNAEEKELEEIAHMRKELAKKRAMSQKSYQKAMTSSGYVPHHSKKEPTMPVDIHFSTDARIKAQPVVPNEKPADFTRSLRSSSKEPPAPPQNKALTRPEPFALSESRKRKVEPESQTSNGFKSMAENVQAFHRQTPERFRSKVVGPPQRCARGKSQGDLTIPKTPQLETRSRTRQVHVPSQKELEEQEIEEMKKHQIKANPVNHRILTEPCVGVKKVTPKPLTKPEEFNLHKSHNVRGNRSQEEERYQFHANPCPTKILEHPVGVKPAKGIPLTHPQSPAFALKHRVRMPLEPEEEKKANTSATRRSVPHHGVPFQPVLSHKVTVPQPFTFEDREKARQVQKEAKIEHYLEEEQKIEEVMVKAHPVPHSGVPFQPKLSHSCTRPQPFSFEERDHVMGERKKEKIQQVYYEEKKAREFHAQPLPDHETHLPERQPRPLTKPEPFELQIDKRGAKRTEEWNSRMAEEEEEKKQKAMFRAKPAVVTHKEPYKAQKSTKPLTDITEFTLSTEQRSQQREDFEMFKKAREAQIESVKRQEVMRKEEEEKQIIAKLRKQAVHQANPIKRFRPVEVAPSDKPLTKPASPQFQTDRRLRSKLQS
ncbi:hypothetical protein FSP39_005973 [Pinctada imbricata]|uniref:Targeting protein for Xklp2 n=1 Tax=Pinctada imbricata TaxID=66713 RepID=A0AA88XQJ5_PINIB|nr:hypothetical protein FSP39_005973 [Pinctada imbricata]